MPCAKFTRSASRFYAPGRTRWGGIRLTRDVRGHEEAAAASVLWTAMCMLNEACRCIQRNEVAGASKSDVYEKTKRWAAVLS